MKIQVTVIVGEPGTPVAGYSKDDFVYADEENPEEMGPRDVLHGIGAAIESLDEAKQSLEKQARAAQAMLGTGPPQ